MNWGQGEYIYLLRCILPALVHHQGCSAASPRAARMCCRATGSSCGSYPTADKVRLSRRLPQVLLCQPRPSLASIAVHGAERRMLHQGCHHRQELVHLVRRACSLAAEAFALRVPRRPGVAAPGAYIPDRTRAIIPDSLHSSFPLTPHSPLRYHSPPPLICLSHHLSHDLRSIRKRAQRRS